MNKLENVVIIDVTKNNFEKLLPDIIEDISKSSFVAIDAEMSGLGSAKKTMNPNLDERYASLSSMAATRSIISLGLACFNSASAEKDTKDCDKITIKYSVSVYNIMLLCSDPYMIDPSAVKFLVNHGFNFNRQFSEGISFYQGNDRDNSNEPQASMRHLFCELVRRRKPLVLHNGLADLIFMYQCFYAQCPSKLTAFTADLSEIFPSGIYDTKFIAEFLDHTPASFLLFLFKFNLLKNEELYEHSKVSLKINFAEGTADTTVICLQKNKNCKRSVAICHKYAEYGWCIHGIHCKKSHNIDAIVQMHKCKTSKKRKKKSGSSSEHSAKVPHLSCTNAATDQPDVMPTNNGNTNDKTVDSECSTTAEDHSHNGDSTFTKQAIAESQSLGSDANLGLHTDIAFNELSHDNDADNSTSSNRNINCQGDQKAPHNRGSTSGNNDIAPSDGHRSGIDAFMTGYIFAVFIASRCKDITVSDIDISNSTDNFSDSIKHLPSEAQKSVVNKLFLSGKSIPLRICKSKFTKTSKNHNEKILKVYLK